MAPDCATDTEATKKAARDLHDRIREPNLLVKIPATTEGVPAIEAMTAEGRSINVTLIFSLTRYAEVLEAYLSGLETLAGNGGDLSSVHSVASFFVSRVDTEVDRRLEKRGTDQAVALRGRAAVAQAKLAYRLFREAHSGERWERLAANGARVQRPLWASTSTKNPLYPDTLYVDQLDRTRHGQHPAGDHHPTRSRTTAPWRARSTSTSRMPNTSCRRSQRRAWTWTTWVRRSRTRASQPSRSPSPTSSAPSPPSTTPLADS